MNGRRRIAHLASALKLGSTHVDGAFRLFQLAVQHNFTQGRRTPNVVAACLYIFCRRNKTPHMLIDFSDVLQTNMFVLGNTYFRLCQTLEINPPLIDPSLYIHRFTAALSLGDNELEVAATALRLVQRMKRDWIQIGRRPAGVCGAALFIATRIHRIHIDKQLILQTIKVCDMTLRRRINEFKNLPSANMTYDDFAERNPEIKPSEAENISWTDETSEDPPIFKEHQRKAQIAALKALTERQTVAAATRNMDLQDYLDSEFVAIDEEEYQKRKAKEEAEELERSLMPPPSSLPNRKKRAAADPNDLTSAAQLGAKRKAELESTGKKTGTSSLAASSASAVVNNRKASLAAEFDAGLQGVIDSTSKSLTEDDPESNHGFGVDEQMKDALDEAQKKGIDSMEAGSVNTAPMTIDASGVTDLSVLPIDDEEEDEVWDASDIPDEAVQEYINTPEQIAVKEMIWEEINRDWTEDQAEKARIAAQLEAEGRPARKPRGRRAGAGAQHAAPKERSRKVNWEAIQAARRRRELGESYDTFLDGTPNAANGAVAGENSAAAGAGGDFDDEDDDDLLDLPVPVRPPPGGFLKAVRPTIPPAGSQSQTQSTQLYGADDDDDDLDDDEEEAAPVDDFTSHFKSNAYEEEDDWD